MTLQHGSLAYLELTPVEQEQDLRKARQKRHPKWMVNGCSGCLSLICTEITHLQLSIGFPCISFFTREKISLLDGVCSTWKHLQAIIKLFLNFYFDALNLNRLTLWSHSILQPFLFHSYSCGSLNYLQFANILSCWHQDWHYCNSFYQCQIQK